MSLLETHFAAKIVSGELLILNSKQSWPNTLCKKLARKRNKKKISVLVPRCINSWQTHPNHNITPRCHYYKVFAFPVLISHKLTQKHRSFQTISKNLICFFLNFTSYRTYSRLDKGILVFCVKSVGSLFADQFLRHCVVWRNSTSRFALLPKESELEI